jgi:hypothetical protein
MLHQHDFLAAFGLCSVAPDGFALWRRSERRL